MSQQTQSGNKSVVTEGLNNLKQIQRGEDPRTSVSETAQNSSDTDRVTSVSIIPSFKLDEFHNEIVRTRDEILDDFVRAFNCIEPDNMYIDNKDNWYPITADDCDFSYCKSTSNYRARCGPRNPARNGNVVGFAPDKTTVGKMTRERYYTLLVHEITHVTENSGTSGSAHNPRFWRTLAEHGVRFIRNWPYEFDVDAFVSHCRYNPNASMTDRRMRTVSEQQEEVEREFHRLLAE
jgi:hypothetical protein